MQYMFAAIQKHFCVFSLLLAQTGGFAVTAVAAESSKSTTCAMPQYRQFDFWVGDWDAFDMDNPAKPVAHARVARILGGCVLLETYESVTGQVGESFTIYDGTRKVWHQTWVTDQGVLLVIEGRFGAGEMSLSGTDFTKDGSERRVRGTWAPINGGVREVAVRSTDGGKTWEPWFDLVFRPHRSR